jgi:hypothetical protein
VPALVLRDIDEEPAAVAVRAPLEPFTEDARLAQKDQEIRDEGRPAMGVRPQPAGHIEAIAMSRKKLPQGRTGNRAPSCKAVNAIPNDAQCSELGGRGMAARDSDGLSAEKTASAVGIPEVVMSFPWDEVDTGVETRVRIPPM